MGIRSLIKIHLFIREKLPWELQILIYFYSHEIFISAEFLSLCSRYYRLTHSTSSLNIILLPFSSTNVGKQNIQNLLLLEFGHVTWFWPMRYWCNFWWGLPCCIKEGKLWGKVFVFLTWFISFLSTWSLKTLSGVIVAICWPWH